MSLTDIDSKTLKEALETAKADRERIRESIIQGEIEKGTAVRAPLLVVAVRESIDAEKARRLAELQDAGEKREVYFGSPLSGEGGEPTGQVIECVCTGVPRAGRDDGYVADPAPPATSIPQRYEKIVPLPEKATAAPASPPVCRSRIWIQTSPPGRRDPGSIAEGWFMVRDGVLYVEDMFGKLLARQPMTATDNPESIARRILRDKAQGGPGDFYRPLPIKLTKH